MFGDKRSSLKGKKVNVQVRFITLIQSYSGKREIRMELPPDPHIAVQSVIETFDIPWKGKLEKSCRIFINKQPFEAFVRDKTVLKTGDLIAFIPISGGG